jgi:hypothetical protein
MKASVQSGDVDHDDLGAAMSQRTRYPAPEAIQKDDGDDNTDAMSDEEAAVAMRMQCVQSLSA